MIMLMLLLGQVRGRPGARVHHVGDPCIGRFHAENRAAVLFI